jgi:hypothetical protein
MPPLAPSFRHAICAIPDNGYSEQRLNERNKIMQRARIFTAAALLVSSLAFGGSPSNANAQVVMCQGLVATIVGTNGNNILTGTGADDVIAGLEGNDVIEGNGGRDTICGGEGADTLRGNGNDDVLNGGPGNDTLRGGDGRDLLDGGQGTDDCNGGLGNNTLFNCEI